MVAIWPKPLTSEPVFYYPPAPPYAGCAMQPGRGVESLHVPGDRLARALWWRCVEAPSGSGEDMCTELAHVPQLWGQVCGPGVRSSPSVEGRVTNIPVVRLVRIMDYWIRIKDYGLQLV